MPFPLPRQKCQLLNGWKVKASWKKIEGAMSELDHVHLNLTDAKYLVKSF